MDTWVWIVIVAAAVLVVLAIVGMVMSRQRRTSHLRETFGSEYDHTVAESDKRGDAERELMEREKRHEEMEIRRLSPAAQSRYQEEWSAIQARFVDDPQGAVRAADGLVARVMEDRGYRSNGDAEQRAADLSVEHADVVGQYRRGHELVEGVDDADDGTESLRQAMKSFRTAFEELLEDRPVAAT